MECKGRRNFRFLISVGATSRSRLLICDFRSRERRAFLIFDLRCGMCEKRVKRPKGHVSHREHRAKHKGAFHRRRNASLWLSLPSASSLRNSFTLAAGIGVALQRRVNRRPYAVSPCVGASFYPPRVGPARESQAEPAPTLSGLQNPCRCVSGTPLSPFGKG